MANKDRMRRDLGRCPHEVEEGETQKQAEKQQPQIQEKPGKGGITVAKGGRSFKESLRRLKIVHCV